MSIPIQADPLRDAERIAAVTDQVYGDELERIPTLDPMGGGLDVGPEFSELEQQVRWGVEYLLVRAKLADRLEARIRLLERHIENLGLAARTIEGQANRLVVRVPDAQTANEVGATVGEVAAWMQAAEPGDHYMSRGEREDTPPLHRED